MRHIAMYKEFLLESIDSLKEIVPNRYVYHTSNPIYRERISREGLLPKGRSESWLTTTAIRGKVIFAVNSNDKEYVWNSTYDDDIYRIDTFSLDNKWYQDPNFEDGIHMVTFQAIPSQALELLHKGTGRSH
jgi:hypothetical protein